LKVKYYILFNLILAATLNLRKITKQKQKYPKNWETQRKGQNGQDGQYGTTLKNKCVKQHTYFVQKLTRVI
jgi:hypothetical protein